jgi:two-component system CheB/CheR fusion protein
MNSMPLPMRGRALPAGGERRSSATSSAARSAADELDRLCILTSELQHRLSNTFQVVLALAQQSARDCESVNEFLADFENRLAVLARVQAAMIRSADDGGISVHHMVSSELAALGMKEADKLVALEGSRTVLLAPRMGEILALGIHELAVNSRKYGVLGAGVGRIRICWGWIQNSERFLRLEWHETGTVPRPRAGHRGGFGSELILHALPRQLGTQPRYSIDGWGVHCVIDIPAEFTVTNPL